MVGFIVDVLDVYNSFDFLPPAPTVLGIWDDAEGRKMGLFYQDALHSRIIEAMRNVLHATYRSVSNLALPYNKLALPATSPAYISQQYNDKKSLDRKYDSVIEIEWKLIFMDNNVKFAGK